MEGPGGARSWRVLEGPGLGGSRRDWELQGVYRWNSEGDWRAGFGSTDGKARGLGAGRSGRLVGRFIGKLKGSGYLTVVLPTDTYYKKT